MLLSSFFPEGIPFLSQTVLLGTLSSNSLIFARGVLVSHVASTLCLNVMPTSMLINDFLYVCVLLSYSFVLITTTMFGEREISSETIIPGPLLARQSFYTSLFIILLSFIIKFENTKKIFAY
jgi:hypothetical protein